MHPTPAPRRSLPKILVLALVCLLLAATSAPGEEYPALEGVSGLDAVFDITLGWPEQAVVTFGGIRDAYQADAVKDLHAAPRIVLVFHGGAVKLLSSDRSDFQPREHEALEKIAAMIRQFKQDGVRMEVCMYAVNAVGVDPATLMPEVERVGNGFVSVAGYQRQGYAVITVP